VLSRGRIIIQGARLGRRWRLRKAKPSDAQPVDKVFKSIPTSATFRRDLTRASIPIEVDGKKLEFHALRTTLGTLLATSGASIREAMEQMRHTDVRLTTRIYTDPRLIDMHGAVNRIPRLSAEPETRETQRATGTDGVMPPVRLPSTQPARSHIRSDIRKEVSGRGQNWPQMAISPSAERRTNRLYPLKTKQLQRRKEPERGGD